MDSSDSIQFDIYEIYRRYRDITSGAHACGEEGHRPCDESQKFGLTREALSHLLKLVESRVHTRLMEDPAAYGKLGLANLLELREECLREFYFADAYRSIKQRENEASLAVLPDLLMEIDSMNEETRLLTLIEGVLAANIFDWGSRACVDLYHKGTIIEIYRMSRKKMQSPWQVADFDLFKERMLGSGDKKPPPHKRALLFVDNSGADVILGMLPLARELLRRGTEVGSCLIELLLQTAYIQPRADQLADGPPDIRPAFVHSLKTVLKEKNIGRRYGVIECDPLVRKGLERTLGATTVNLVAGEKPAAVYSGIAARVLDIMRKAAQKDPEVFPDALRARLLINQVDRKLMKQTDKWPYITTALMDAKLGTEGRKDLFDWLSRQLSGLSNFLDAVNLNYVLFQIVMLDGCDL